MFIHSEKLFTHVESNASTVSLLESGEYCDIKAINKNNNVWLSLISLMVSVDVKHHVCLITTTCLTVLPLHLLCVFFYSFDLLSLNILWIQ